MRAKRSKSRRTGQFTGSLGSVTDNIKPQMYIDHPQAPRPGHKFNGYYFKYPSEQGYQGMVSTISDDPPMLNWLFVDKDTGAIRYGSRKDSEGHVIGPWGWSEDEQYLVIDGDDWRFIAVEEDAPPEPKADGEPAGVQRAGEDENQEMETGKCWAVYLSRDRDGSLKPKAERAQEGEDSEEESEDEDEDEPLDVRYTNKWVPIRLVRKLQLGVESGWLKGPRPSHQRQ